MSILNFPVKKINWGFFCERMNAFVGLTGIKDKPTYKEADELIHQCYTQKTIDKEKLYAKPKEVYLRNGGITEDDI